MRVGAWEWSLDTQTLTWAPELYRICEVELGYAPTLTSMQDFFPVEHRDAFMRAIEKQGLTFAFPVLGTPLRNSQAGASTAKAEKPPGQ